MKKVLLMVIGLAVFAGAANAMGPAAYVGIYGDEARTVMEKMGLYQGFDVYVFVNPSDNGVSVLEYKLAVEGITGIATLLTTKNPDMGFSSGDAYGGSGIMISCPCQLDWFWTYSFSFMIVSADPGYFVIESTDTPGSPNVGGCDPLKTLEPLNPILKFGLNTLHITPNESSTWGAIKSLIKE